MWLVDWWNGHLFVPWLVREASPVAPTNSRDCDLSADLHLSTLDVSERFHSLFSGIRYCLDSLIFASFSSQLANESQVETLVFLQQTRPITAKACRKFSNSCFRDISCFSELSLWRKSCSLKMPKSSETIFIDTVWSACHFLSLWPELDLCTSFQLKKLCLNGQNVPEAQSMPPRICLNLAWISLDMISHFRLQNLAEV